MIYDCKVSRSNDPAHSWWVLCSGRCVASFRTFDEAIAAARAWDLAESTA